MEHNNFTLTVNSKFDHQISTDFLSGLDIIKVGQGKYHFIQDLNSFEVEIMDVDLVEKKVTLKIGHEKFEVFIADAYDLLIEKMGLELDKIQQINDIKAPMPGMVISIETAVGKKVGPGEPLLILEAMKMENVIKSHGEGTVKRILTEKGQAVDKGDILVEME